MADDEKKKEGSKKKDPARPVVPKTALELQRFQYEKLMKDPVCLNFLLPFPCICANSL